MQKIKETCLLWLHDWGKYTPGDFQLRTCKRCGRQQQKTKIGRW